MEWRHLEDMFAHFEKGARVNRAGYLVMRTVVLVAGALVPILALGADSSIAVACVGAAVVVAEGLTQLTQAHGHWLRYRRSAEALRREALSFVSKTGPYQRGELSRQQLLVSRMLDVVAQENDDWESTLRSSDAKPAVVDVSRAAPS